MYTLMIISNTIKNIQKQTQQIKNNSMDFLTKNFEAITLALQAQLAIELQTARVFIASSQPMEFKLQLYLPINLMASFF